MRTLGGLLISRWVSPPALLLLLSLFIWLPSLFSLLLLSTEPVVVSSPPVSGLDLGGADQRGTPQTTPVKLLSVKPPFCHFRHGVPDLSSARKPALIAPWFALGPSLW